MFWVGVGVGMLSVDDAGGVLVLLVLVFEVVLWLWGVVVLVGAVGLLVLVAFVGGGVALAWVFLLVVVWSCVP